MSIKLNDKTIKAAKAGAKAREGTIAGHPNLVLKIYPASARYPAGTKTFTYRYRTKSGIRRVTIDTYPAMFLQEVREHYLEHERTRAEGGDPQRESRKHRESLAEVTCAMFAEIYMDRWAVPRKRTHAEDRRILDKDIIPRIDSMPTGFGGSITRLPADATAVNWRWTRVKRVFILPIHSFFVGYQPPQVASHADQAVGGASPATHLEEPWIFDSGGRTTRTGWRC